MTTSRGEQGADRAEGPFAPADAAAMVFSGKQAAALDSKNRVGLPAKFREEIPSGTPLRALPHPDGCVALYPEPEFHRFRDELKRKRTDDDAYSDEAVRQIFSRTEKLTPDATHRILVTEDLKEAAGITKDVMFVGVDNRIELWDAGRWAAREALRQESLQKLSRTYFR